MQSLRKRLTTMSVPIQLAMASLSAALACHTLLINEPTIMLLLSIGSGWLGWLGYQLAHHQWRNALLLILTGLASASWFAWHYTANAPMSQPYRHTTVTAVVDTLPENEPHRQQFTVRIESSASLTLIGKRAQVTHYYTLPENIRAGQRLEITADWQPAAGLRNPHSFDYATYLRTRHIHATAYLGSGSHVKILEETACCSKHRWREWLRERLMRYADHPQYALLLGLSTGDRSQMTGWQRDTLQRTGTSHLLAISGLHIGLVAGMAWLLWFQLARLFPRLTLRTPAPMIALLGSIAPALLYALLAGLTTPTLRAVSMLILFTIGYARYRLLRLWDIIALAVVITLVIDPLSMLTAGFWLSFYATTLILGFIDIRRRAGLPLRSFAIIDVAWLQVSLIAGMSLLTIYYFGGLSISSPLSNLIAIPWASVVTIPLVLLGALCESLSPTLADGVLWLALHSLDLLWSWLSLLSQWDYSFIALPKPALLALWLSPALMITLAHRLRRWRWNLVGVIVLLIAFAPGLKFPAFPGSTAHSQLTVLSVRNGLTAVLESPELDMPILIGAGNGGFYADPIAEYTLLPYLAAKQLRPNMLLLPFLKQDVSGGTRLLRETFPGIAVITPKADLTIGSHTCAGLTLPNSDQPILRAQLWDDAELPSCLLHITLADDASAREILMIPSPLLGDPKLIDRIERIQRLHTRRDAPTTLIIIHTGRRDFDPQQIPAAWVDYPNLQLIVSGKVATDAASPAILSTDQHGAITLTAASTIHY